jgi:hypothetical protein
MPSFYFAWRYILLVSCRCCFRLAMHALNRKLERLQTNPRANEFDTADPRRGGRQAGGRQIGRGYRSADLRCGAGEAIVGAQIRRGDALDFLQIGCGRLSVAGTSLGTVGG